jgi:hypothetical protein
MILHHAPSVRSFLRKAIEKKSCKKLDLVELDGIEPATIRPVKIELASE